MHPAPTAMVVGDGGGGLNHKLEHFPETMYGKNKTPVETCRTLNFNQPPGFTGSKQLKFVLIACWSPGDNARHGIAITTI